MLQSPLRVSSSPILRFDTHAPYYKWCVAGLVLLAEATGTFAGNSVILAIPSLMASFGTDLATAQWIITGFLITRTLIIPVLGWLGAILGNRNLFVVIMAGFVVTMIGCGLSTSITMLVGFRLMQGLVLGPMEGLSAVILVQAFPPPQRGMALGMRTIGWAVGQIISFTLGGYFIEHISWRLIFFIGIPGGMVAAILGLLLLPQQREYRGEPVDYSGLLLLGGFLIPLLLTISFGRSDTTTTSTLLLLGLGSVVGGGLFVVWELYTAYPAVNLRLFRTPVFCFLCSTAFFNNMGLFGAQFIVPIFLQQVIGLTPLQAGLVIVPALIVSGSSGVITGWLADLFRAPILIIIGLLTLMGIFYAFSTVTALTGIGVLVGYIMLYRICMFGVTTPVTALNVQVLDSGQVRMGQGLLGVVRNIGASLGVTITSVFFEQQRVFHQLQAYDTYNATTPDHLTTIGELRQSLQQASASTDAADQEALRTIQQQMDLEAIAAGFRDSFLLVCVCFLVASLPMVWVSLRRLDRTSSDASATT
jgi:DHA2 family multidrug resistance protein